MMIPEELEAIRQRQKDWQKLASQLNWHLVAQAAEDVGKLLAEIDRLKTQGQGISRAAYQAGAHTALGGK